MTDNIALLDGYTREVVAESDEHILFLLIRPDTCYDDRFRAWDTDAQEFIHVNGCLFAINDWDKN